MSREQPLLALIEIPRGSRNKYEYDERLGRFRLDRVLYSPLHYPSDYGLILDTLSSDGDPLDVLVIVYEPTFTGCVVPIRPIGVLLMRDEKGIDEKVVAVPIGEPRLKEVQRLADLPAHVLREIEHFFTVYKDLEEKEVEVYGWADVEAAWKLIEEAQQRHRLARGRGQS